MPIEVQVVHGGAGRLWTLRGVFSGKELIARNEETLRTKRYEGVRWMIMDETEATSIDVSPEEVRIITQQDERMAAVLPEMVTAIVAPHDLGFGMSRMWEALTERQGWSTRTFRSRPEAEAWLREEVRRRFRMELPEDLTTP